jgi:hypothetical protein
MEHGPIAPRAARILAALCASPLVVFVAPRDPSLWLPSRERPPRP